MMLPPVVITRTTDGKPVFLGPNGWTPLRREALSFDFEAGARDWMKQVPKLTAGAAVTRVECEPEDPGQPKHSSEYDPSEAA